ncbi:hypothetical protein KSP40_PGU001757 [Platanthera guangdongensis]|uniref:Uncharacterized protein n=1 Tax=Platanthera guangdongensis TaxID=2320717 RepID=A0ABR2M193_9ASPA
MFRKRENPESRTVLEWRRSSSSSFPRVAALCKDLLSLVETEKRLSLILAWEESKKVKAENKKNLEGRINPVKDAIKEEYCSKSRPIRSISRSSFSFFLILIIGQRAGIGPREMLVTSPSWRTLGRTLPLAHVFKLVARWQS